MSDRLQEAHRPIEPVVVGVDGSEHSLMALHWAADEANRRGSQLRVLYGQITAPEHVPDWYHSESTTMRPADAVVEDALCRANRWQPGLVVNGELVDWPPAMVLTGASRSAAVLVVGGRGLGGFKELLLGSVSDQCLQYAHCPVAVVHSAGATPPGLPSKPRIVVGIDGSLGSTRGLRWALAEAEARGASVEAVVAWEYDPLSALVTGTSSGHEAVAREVADAAIDHAGRLAPRITFTAEARLDATVPALLDACRGADLLVVGSQGHGGFRGALLGSVAHQCARHASCDVVVVRPHSSEAGSGGERVLSKGWMRVPRMDILTSMLLPRQPSSSMVSRTRLPECQRWRGSSAQDGAPLVAGIGESRE
jgi:nucleotide-binding universal stress UspA family protein